MKFIIMCGGQGTKLWPISKDNFPKQFNNILGKKSLYQVNMEQLLSKYDPKDIYVSTSENYVDFIARQSPEIPRENYIIEPHLKKMNGPACCWSLLHLLKEFPNEPVMFYVQPVVIREPTDKYLHMIDITEQLVNTHGKLVTGGKYPKYPEVGSDYQELGNKISNTQDLEVYQTKRFIARPKTLDEAQELMGKKLALHCNHLTWTPRKFFEALQIYCKDWFVISMELLELISNNANYDDILEVYSKFEPGNVEVFTRNLYDAGEVFTVILPFEWMHITTWNDIYELAKIKRTRLGNGMVVTIDSDNNLILNKTNKIIGTIGLKDMIVVQTEEALLVCPRNDTGKLTKLLEKIEDEGLQQFL